MPAQPKWILDPSVVDPANDHIVAELSRRFGLDPLVIRLAMRRGFTEPTALERYLHPRLQDLTDPFRLPGMQAAVDRILKAVDGAETVVIYGDYDVDGVTSVAFLFQILTVYGLSPATFLPHRIDQGYGLSMDGIERVLAEHRPTLIIAADCGTNSCAEARLLTEKGIDLVILDHHEAGESGRADCVALVNPKLGDEFHYLCTGGVVFKVAHALLKDRPRPDFDLRQYLDLVALATVADIVPLVDENRIFVRRGLSQLDRTTNPGLRELKNVASVHSPARAYDVGFKLGPRLNASGRLDSARESLDLLLADDPAEARRCAQCLDQRNRERQQLEQNTRQQAEDQIAALPADECAAAIVAGGDGWHPGVVGIVASRIVRQYHRPTFIIAFDEQGLGKGSGRSVPGISLVEAIDHCRDLLESGGGHEMAAGLSVRRKNYDAFRRRFHDYIASVVAAHVDGDLLESKLHIDSEIHFSELNLELLDSYELLRPFGTGNPQPLLMSRGVRPIAEPRVIKEKHLKLTLEQDGVRHDAIWFGGAERELPRPPWDVAFTIDRNDWRGNVSVSVMVQALRGTRASAADPDPATAAQPQSHQALQH